MSPRPGQGADGRAGRWRSCRPALLALLLTGALAAGTAAASPAPRWTEALDARVHALATAFPGALSLYVRDVTHGDEYAYQAEDVTYLSSTIKLVVALEVLRQVDARRISLEDTRVFGPEDVRDGMGPLRHTAPGRRFTVRALLRLMLVHSDNAAADLLIGVVGVDNLRAHLARRGVSLGPLVSLLDERRRIYGLLDARAEHLAPQQVRELGQHDALGPRAQALSRMLGRLPPWTGAELATAFERFYVSGVNSGSMREMGRLLEQMAACDGLSRSSCKRLRSLMTACRTGSQRLRAGFPGHAAWAHKTGTQYRRACDVGVLYPHPDRPVVVAACARDFTRVKDAEAVFAQLGAAIWDALVPSLPLVLTP